MSDYALQPMDFGQIMGRTWEITKRTFSTSGLLAALVYIPLILFVGLMLDTIMSAAASSAMQVGENADPEEFSRTMMPMIGAYMLFYPVIALYSLLIIPFMQSAMIVAGWEAINDRDIPFGDMVRRTFGRPFWYVVAQNLLVSILAGVASMIGTFVVFALALMTAGIGIVIAYPLAIAAGIYLFVSIAFRMHHVVIEDRGPWHGITESFELVKGNWWRIFAVLFVIMVAVYIIVGIVSIPSILEVVETAGTLQQYDENDPRAVAAGMEVARSFFSPLMLIAGGVLAIAATVFLTNALTVLYADLRARPGDFDAGEENDISLVH